MTDNWWRQPAVFDMVDTVKEEIHMPSIWSELRLLSVVLLAWGIRLAFAVVTFLAMILLIRALLKYLRSGEVRQEKNAVKASLGEVLRKYRTERNMTQEFVAESLGVSRQAVSKWEKGISDPSTSNLLALAKLYGVSVEELLKEVE